MRAPVVTAALLGLAAASPSCCLYGGSGAATLSATATLTLDVGTGRAALLPSTIAADPAVPFVSVLVGAATPFAAEAGWIITSNATHQIMTSWVNNTAGVKPVCSQGAIAAGFVPGFAMCPGAAGSLFPTPVTSLDAGSIALNVFAQGAVGSATGTFTGEADGCAMLTMLSPGSPVGNGGAFSLAVTAGNGAKPAASMGVPPAACGF